jgi:fructose-1-phosphate kinase PfkB-like protein
MVAPFPVLVFCPNLAVDHLIEVDELAVGEVQHARRGTLSAGGKGLNVARAAHHFGVRVRVVGVVAGRTGALLSSLLAAEDITVESPPLHLDTRIATIVLDHVNGTTTVLNEPGPTVGATDWNALTDLVRARLPESKVLVCNGSLLPAAPVDGYCDLIDAARSAGMPTIVDVAGNALRRCAERRPTVI